MCTFMVCAVLTKPSLKLQLVAGICGKATMFYCPYRTALGKYIVPRPISPTYVSILSLVLKTLDLMKQLYKIYLL